MPLQQDQLDDWTFRELVIEGLSILPRAAPRWTDYNASDPGITLLELFAYFTEIMVFQTGQLTVADKRAFLKLLTGGEEDTHTTRRNGELLREDEALDQALQQALLATRQPQRAVTAADYEMLALRADPRVARARCVPFRNLAECSEAARDAERPGHVSVVLVPARKLGKDDTAAALQKVANYLDGRRILTTRVHVVWARLVPFEVHLHIVANLGVASQAAIDQARGALQTFFDPWGGGLDGTGWPLGRAVFTSEIYLVVSRLSTVDHLTRGVDERTGERAEERTLVTTAVDRFSRNADGDLIGLQLAPDELPGKVTFLLTARATAENLGREV